MTELAQVEQKRIDEIQQMMDGIDIETDCKSSLIGSINCVAASGGEPSEEAIKLAILRDRKDITIDEAIDLGFQFAHQNHSKNDEN